MSTYEHTAEQMARKSLEFNRDFCDFDDDIQEELEHLTRLFTDLQASEKYNALAHHLDVMFMDSAFN